MSSTPLVRIVQSSEKTLVTLMFFATSIAYLIALTLIAAAVTVIGSESVAVRSIAQKSVERFTTYGWVGLTIMGAMYRIVSTLGGRTLDRSKMIRLQFGLANVGIMGSVLSPQTANAGPWESGFVVLLLASTMMFTFNIATGLKGVSKPPVLVFFIYALPFLIAYSAVDLVSTVAQSAIVLPARWSPLSIDLVLTDSPVRVLRYHLFALGFVSLTIIGAVYQLLPMLSLQPLRSPAAAFFHSRLALYAILGLLVGVIMGNASLLVIFGALYLVGVLLFSWNILSTLSRRPRRLNMVVITHILAVFYLLSVVVIGILNASGSLRELYPYGSWRQGHSHLALMGFATVAIVGTMFHIVPTLAWSAKYGRDFGKPGVPSPRDLFNPRVAVASLILFNISAAMVAAGFIVDDALLRVMGGLVFLAALLPFAWTMYSLIGLAATSRRRTMQAVGGR